MASDPDSADVKAAGGLVMRDDGRVAVAHRPRYDDWSFPKGKLAPHAGAFYCKACLKKAKSATGTWHMGPGISAAAMNADRPARSAGGSKAHAPNTDRKRLLIMASVLVALVLLALVMNFVILAD